MCKIALTLPCLVAAADGQRAQRPLARTQASPDQIFGVASSDSQSFAEVGAEEGFAMLLLALGPASASWSTGTPHALGMRGGRSHLLRQPQQGRVAEDGPKMLNLFGNSEESRKRREALSLRDPEAGTIQLDFRKPNRVTTGLLLGLKFREGWGKAVYVDEIIPGTEADQFKQRGQLQEGDEVTMVSATFGDEMWSARGIGKYRLEKSISVRQGMFLSLCVERRDQNDMFKMMNLKKEQEKEQARMTRMQKQLQSEVDNEKKKGGGWFR
jgi:hypothetical protein